MRSAWISQELLSTFQEELYSVTLTPSRPPEEGGRFLVSIDDELLWDRQEMGGFPETKELKRLVRDVVSPQRDLGHVDSHSCTNSDDGGGGGGGGANEEKIEIPFNEIGDDEAEDMRSFFGVM
mmetsp:Transcript_4448/g.6802  ORF Transcript_4448/g.6802 Transcript_4448/m.6802 type:complete len:123 (+) Transcript_4448:3-371(+)|eukprot:CAMPEP_0197236740 /NCGR_PEP_ID=MMETSP1429-20130617/3760_1 /TAXON_ID=49237 /ORGANISM="Chaetoceros  sp., Strain UNC1202" /LENGTH=122 /DNA_ID=CAMNT_0042695599 /DNA_START=1 /DNA_END=369 /DNA_ORIENTATION=+